MEAIENPNNKTLDEALKEKSKNKKKVEKIRVVGCKECGLLFVIFIPLIFILDIILLPFEIVARILFRIMEGEW